MESDSVTKDHASILNFLCLTPFSYPLIQVSEGRLQSLRLHSLLNLFNTSEVIQHSQ